MVEKAKKTILITGASGVLGRALVKRLESKYKVAALTRKDCDVTDSKKVASVFLRLRPNIVIHTAAFTDVDGCQKDSQRAYAINAQGTYAIAKNAQSAGAMLIYLSTDYVFSGRKKTPYREEDRPGALSIYAKTKLKGEQIVEKLVKRHIIIRTSWLFGKGKTNFIDTVLKLARGPRPFKIVSDKYACPTDVYDLAMAIEEMIDLIIRADNRQDKFYGTYHITNSGFCSWYEYAKFILRAAKLKSIKIKPIPMCEMPFLARRPVFSVLDNSKYRRTFKLRLRPWQDAVKEYIECRYN